MNKMTLSIKQAARATLFIPLALVLMGNQKCEKEPEVVAKRELRRRAMVGTLEAPPMPLPSGGNFDFEFAANMQLQEVMRKTQSFSTATYDSTTVIDPSAWTEEDRQAFYSCEDSTLSGKTGALESRKMSKEAVCMMRMPQAIINGGVINFQLISTTGAEVSVPQWANLGVDFSVSKARLTMTMQADDPLTPGLVLAATSGSATQTETNVGAGFNLGYFALGMKYYYASDLAQVVYKGLENAILGLKDQMDENEPWYTTVIKNCDKAIMINAGNAADAGLKVGDILEVYNQWYDWEGEVCDSDLRGVMASSNKPAAVVEVITVGTTMSLAKVIEQTEEKIVPGARVKVRSLVPNAPVASSKSSK